MENADKCLNLRQVFPVLRCCIVLGLHYTAVCRTTVLQGVGIALYCGVQYSVIECTVMFGCVLYGTILYCSGTLVLLWL